MACHRKSSLSLPSSLTLSSWCSKLLQYWAYLVIYGVLFSHAIPMQSIQAQDFEFPDHKQGEFAKTLRDYEISIPTKVDNLGQFLSHQVHHHLRDHLPRHKRDTMPKDSNVQYKVKVDGMDLHLDVRPNHKLFAPGLVFETRSGSHGNLTGTTLELWSHNKCHLKGEVKDHPGSQIALSTCNGLHGLLRTNKGDYFIEPVKGHYLTSDPRHPHLVYKASSLPPEVNPHHARPDPQSSKGEKSKVKTHSKLNSQNRIGERSEARDQVPGCGVTDSDHHTYSTSQRVHSAHSRHKRSVSLERHVETLVVVDTEMVQYYQNEDIDTYILTIMNMVSTIYHDATLGNAVNIVLVRVLKLQDPEPGLKVTHHADDTLRSFCAWQNTINPRNENHPNHHDVAILLTRYNICSRMNEPCSTLGLAQVSGMCQPHRSCNVNEDTGLALAFTVAHEMGHNFDMRHDGIQNGCIPDPNIEQFVMSPQLNAGAMPLVWSECSKQSITNFLDRDSGYCLDDEPTEHPSFVFPKAPPGVMYDADHQCRLQYGPNTSYCEGIGDDVCKTLWCKVDNKCLTRLEAAAQGTICGENKWCSGGRCVTIGDKPMAIDGQWGQWNSWTECSRTCGAGVSMAERHCEHPPPQNGGRYCLGERKRYRICNIDACKEGEPTFREQQCREFNDIPYQKEKLEWEALHKTDPLSMCQLHCKPKNKMFSARMKDIVTDGTPCRLGQRDVCIAGRCRKVGCDWQIDSNAMEDHCGVCHGDGTTCKKVNKEFKEKNGMGYVEAMVIPEGARNIRVEEVAEANNYLAIKSNTNQYYLNGNWYIQWSGDYKAAGTVIHYMRNGNKESFNAIGPIKEPLHIMLLFQSANPGVTIEYTVPNENATEARKPEFFWKYQDWTHCTSSCGGGFQRSEVVCVEKEAGMVEDHHCNISIKPDDMQKSCNTHMCPAKWWVGPWQHCSVTCGPGGMHRRTVLCIRSLGPDNQMALEDHECEGLVKPSVYEPCHHVEECAPEGPHWVTGPWTQTCTGDPCAMQTREVTCSDIIAECKEDRPRTQRQCSNVTCGTWEPQEWSTCTRTCEGGIQFRSVKCLGGEACQISLRPAAEQDCNTQPCPSTTPTTTLQPVTTTTIPTTILSSTTTSSILITTPRPSSSLSELPSVLNEEEKKKARRLRKKQRRKINRNHNTVLDEGDSTSEDYTEEDSSGHDIPGPGDEQNTFGRPLKQSSGKQSEAVAVDEVRVESQRYLRQSTSSHTDRSTTTTTSFAGEISSSYAPLSSKQAYKTSTPVLTSSSTMLGTSTALPTTSTISYPAVLTYRWTPLFWGKCSRACGDGIQTRRVICIDTYTLEEVDQNLCDGRIKLKETQPCNHGRCLDWEASNWSQCSQTCGDGEQRRTVKCPIPGLCDPYIDVPKVQACNLGPCLSWIAGPWGQCSKSCGSGTQMRNVECVDLSAQHLVSGCDPALRPHNTQQCSTEECKEEETGALNSQTKCTGDLMSYTMCKTLLKMGQCEQSYVQKKCCRTCHNFTSQHKSSPMVSS